MELVSYKFGHAYIARVRTNQCDFTSDAPDLIFDGTLTGLASVHYLRNDNARMFICRLPYLGVG